VIENLQVILYIAFLWREIQRMVTGRGSNRRSRRAQAGIGTLIIFIALILISSMVVAVLISTTNIFKGKIVETSQSGEQKVTTGIRVVSISGETTGGNIDTLYLVIEPTGGSGPIDISTMVLQVVLSGTDTAYLTYDSSDDIYENGNFTVSQWIRMRNPSDRTSNPYIEDGDLVELSIELSESQTRQLLSPDSSLLVLFMIDGGIDKRVEATTPSIYPSDGTVVIYP